MDCVALETSKSFWKLRPPPAAVPLRSQASVRYRSSRKLSSAHIIRNIVVLPPGGRRCLVFICITGVGTPTIEGIDITTAFRVLRDGLFAAYLHTRAYASAAILECINPPSLTPKGRASSPNYPLFAFPDARGGCAALSRRENARARVTSGGRRRFVVFLISQFPGEPASFPLRGEIQLLLGVSVQVL